MNEIAGTWFAITAWSWGLKVGAFLLTWLGLACLCEWVTGKVTRLGTSGGRAWLPQLNSGPNFRGRPSGSGRRGFLRLE